MWLIVINSSWGSATWCCPVGILFRADLVAKFAAAKRPASILSAKAEVLTAGLVNSTVSIAELPVSRTCAPDCSR